MTEEKSCGCVIFARNAEGLTALLTQNKKGLHWSFPKGHVEAGETEIMTAKREVREETGLSVEPYPDFTIANKYKTSKGSLKTVIYFVATANTTDKLELQEAEVGGAKWCEIGEARTILTHANDVKILNDAAAYYRTRRG